MTNQHNNDYYVITAKDVINTGIRPTVPTGKIDIVRINPEDLSFRLKPSHIPFVEGSVSERIKFAEPCDFDFVGFLQGVKNLPSDKRKADYWLRMNAPVIIAANENFRMECKLESRDWALNAIVDIGLKDYLVTTLAAEAKLTSKPAAPIPTIRAL